MDSGQGDDAASTTSRSQDLRASLEAIVSEAERVSEELLDESRATAAATTRAADEHAADILDQARAAADVIRSRAESEVEEHRRRVRAEVLEQVRTDVAEQNRHELATVRAQSQAVIGDLEASVRILGVTMESAVANITEMLSALEQLRLHTSDPMPPPRSVATAAHASEADPLQQSAPGPASPVGALGEPLADPAFEQSRPPAAVPHPAPVYDDHPAPGYDDHPPPAEGDGGADVESERTPMTASEAFLNASSFDAETAEATDGRQQQEDAAEREPVERGPREDAAREDVKPLGWLFRSPD